MQLYYWSALTLGVTSLPAPFERSIISNANANRKQSFELFITSAVCTHPQLVPRTSKTSVTAAVYWLLNTELFQMELNWILKDLESSIGHTFPS